MIYHRDNGRISSSSKIFNRDGIVKGFQADSLAKAPSAKEVGDEYQRLVQMEKDCLQKLRDMERETTEILERREEEEHNIELRYSFYDARKNKVKCKDNLTQSIR